MLSYFPGGFIADRFSARKLMSYSLISTSLGGFYLYTLPPINHLYWLFAYWGITSTLLFWAAMIKTTREWGNTDTQGLAFGLLDGGRGMVASVLSSIIITLINFQIVQDIQNSHITSQQTLQLAILFYSFATLLGAFLIWYIMPNNTTPTKPPKTVRNFKVYQQQLIEVISNKLIWLQAGVIITAYCGFKSLDNYGLYAVQVLEMSAIESAEFVTYTSYARPFSAIAAGLLVDKWRATSMIVSLFILLTIIFLILGISAPNKVMLTFITINLCITFIGIYALRGIYFALLEESQLPTHLTGKAVGLISLLGYTPDIFFASVTGRILDANPGIEGFHHYFILMSLISALGIISAYVLSKLSAKKISV